MIKESPKSTTGESQGPEHGAKQLVRGRLKP